MSDRINTYATEEQLTVLQNAYAKSTRAVGPTLKALSEETGLYVLAMSDVEVL